MFKNIANKCKNVRARKILIFKKNAKKIVGRSAPSNNVQIQWEEFIFEFFQICTEEQSTFGKLEATVLHCLVSYQLRLFQLHTL